MPTAKKVVKEATKSVKKVAKKDNTCTDCGGTGLKDKFTLCRACVGSGKV